METRQELFTVVDFRDLNRAITKAFDLPLYKGDPVFNVVEDMAVENDSQILFQIGYTPEWELIELLTQFQTWREIFVIHQYTRWGDKVTPMLLKIMEAADLIKMDTYIVEASW